MLLSELMNKEKLQTIPKVSMGCMLSPVLGKCCVLHIAESAETKCSHDGIRISGTYLGILDLIANRL